MNPPNWDYPMRQKAVAAREGAGEDERRGTWGFLAEGVRW